MFENIVVGADGSSTAQRAVEAAADMARLHGANLHVVSASSAEQRPSRSATGGYVDPAHPAQSLLESLTQIGKDRGLEPVIHPASGSPADAVVAVAGEVGADLIVVGNKGMKGAGRVLGSVPNSVAHSAPCSVLIFDSLGAD
jgi:nucleotide-binding universal stress UspA family protein